MAYIGRITARYTVCMEKYISKETQSDISKVGYYQIAGSLISVTLILWGIISSGLEESLFLFIFILLFLSWSIYCGIHCLKTRKNCLQYSLINQLLQTIGIAIFGIVFQYAAGPYLYLGVNLTESGRFLFGAGLTNIVFAINSESDQIQIECNLVAIVFTFWIIRLMKKVKREKELNKTTSIGET